MYTVTCIGLVLFLFTYYWIIAFHISLGIKELKINRWMEPIYNLEDKCLTEEQYFKDEFSIFKRLPLSIYLEIRQQFWYLEDALNWIISFTMYWLNAAFMAVVTPLLILYLPINYYGKRIAVVCACTTKKRGKRWVVCFEIYMTYRLSVELFVGLIFFFVKLTNLPFLLWIITIKFRDTDDFLDEETQALDEDGLPVESKYAQDEISRTVLSYKSIKAMREGEEGVSLFQATITILYRYSGRRIISFMYSTIIACNDGTHLVPSAIFIETWLFFIYFCVFLIIYYISFLLFN